METIAIKDLGMFPAKVVRKYRDAFVASIRQTMHERGPGLITEAVFSTTPRPPFDRGTYANSWVVEDIPDGAELMSKDMKASIIENGRRPGTGVSRDGVAAIANWVHRHNLIDLSKLSVAHARRQQTFMDFLDVSRKSAKKIGKDVIARAELGMAFAIAANIKKRGMPAQNVLERATRKLLVEVIENARDVVAQGGQP